MRWQLWLSLMTQEHSLIGPITWLWGMLYKEQTDEGMPVGRLPAYGRCGSKVDHLGGVLVSALHG